MEEGRGKHEPIDPGFHFFKDRQTWVKAAAGLVGDTIRKRVREVGTAVVALAGGRTPRPVYERLGRPPYPNEIPWEAVHFFWSDERCVPWDDPQSNYGTAREAFLSRVPLPPKNVHPVPVAEGTCRVAADHYEQKLRQFFKLKSGSTSDEGQKSDERWLPVFDLILLGLGRDGHTASLFPENSALEEQHRWVVHVPESPQPPFVPRITLTLPVINRARRVVFLVSGGDKTEILEKIRLEENDPYSPYPAARARPTGELVWIVLT